MASNGFFGFLKNSWALAARPRDARHKAQRNIQPAGGRSTPPRWRDLDASQRLTVAGNLRRAAAYYARGRYDPVTRDAGLREWFAAERGGEETALPVPERNRLIAAIRQLTRNGTATSSLLEQLELNVVGATGGKAFFSFPDDFSGVADRMRAAFGRWARECGFFDGSPIQLLLKLALRTKYVSGRAVLLFDAGEVCGSGKIILIEGDCVASLVERDFRSRFPARWTQHDGIVKNEYGQTVGAICSFAQRGQSEFHLFGEGGKPIAWTLVKPAATPWLDSPWCVYQHTIRANQVAAVPALAPSVGAAMDLEALTKYEMQTAKKAAQTIASVTQPESDANSLLGSGLDPSAATPLPADASQAEVDEAAAAYVGEVADAGAPTLDLPEIDGSGTIYDVLPPGLKMELLTPSHPNPNVQGMVQWLRGACAWANGMARIYASGQADASYSASLVEQHISWQKFVDEQHQLQLLMDWILLRWHDWAWRRGDAPAPDELPPDWIRMVDYNWPRKQQPDPNKEQDAEATGLRTGTLSWRDIRGPDYLRHFDQLQLEQRQLAERGVPNPRLETVSGQVISATSQQPVEN